MLELLYFFLAMLLMLSTAVLVSIAVVLVFKFAPEVPNETTIEKPGS